MSLSTVSASLTFSLHKIANCRMAALESDPWRVLPLVVYGSIIQIASEQHWDHEYVVIQHADDFIRANDRAGLIFRAGKLRGASAHDLAERIRNDFMHKSHAYALWISTPKEEFAKRIMLDISNESPSDIQAELRQLPDFNTEELMIQLQQELAFAEAKKPAPKKQTKRQEPKNAKRDAKFFDLHQNGKSDGDIAAVWNAENPLNRVTKGTVRQGISRHRKRLRLRDIS